MYQHLFGPVPSRRLGISLGIDLVPMKTCTMEDLNRILGLHANEVNKYLDVLEADQKIEVVQQERGFFYRIK